MNNTVNIQVMNNDDSLLYIDSLTSWESAFNYKGSLAELLLTIIDSFVVLPNRDEVIKILISYLLYPSSLGKVCPLLICYGEQGSGKSTIGVIASKLYNINVMLSTDTFAAIRNYLESHHTEKVITAEKNIVTGEIEEISQRVESNKFLIWDDITETTFNLQPNIYAMLKSGYDKSTDTVTIATKEGNIQQFRTFCPKVISTTQPIFNSSRYWDLHRRSLVIRTKKLERFKESEKPSNYNKVIDPEILEINEVSWDGLTDVINAFWSDENNKRIYKAWWYKLRDLKQSLDSHNWTISRDLMAVGLSLGLFTSRIDAINYYSKYWDIFKKEIANSVNEELRLLSIWIDAQKEKINDANSVFNMNPNKPFSNLALERDIVEWNAKKLTNEKITPKKLKTYMNQLGYRLYNGYWVEI